LEGIGPVKANRIVTFRAHRGRFPSLDDLALVSGISSRMVDSFRKEIFCPQDTIPLSSADHLPSSLGRTVQPEGVQQTSTRIEKPASCVVGDDEAILCEEDEHLPVQDEYLPQDLAPERPPKKNDLVRLCFNPGIINLNKGHHTVRWPERMIQSLQGKARTSSSQSSSMFSMMKDNLNALRLQAGITEQDLDQFGRQMEARFTERSHQAVHIYTWSDARVYELINNALNSNRPRTSNQSLSGWSEVLDEMVAFVRQGNLLPNTVYRGCIATSSEIDFYVSRECRFAWKGFVSTSKEFHVALRFAQEGLSRRKVSPVVFAIQVLSTCPGGADISALSYYPTESEILFLPGMSLQVDLVQDLGLYVLIHCHQIPSPFHHTFTGGTHTMQNKTLK